MKLEVHERLALLTLFPKDGDYAALKTFRRAFEMLSFTPEDMKFYEFVGGIGQDGKPVTNWNSTKAAEAVKDCPIDEFTTDYLRNKLSEMQNKKKLSEDFLSIYEKFVIAYS